MFPLPLTTVGEMPPPPIITPLPAAGVLLDPKEKYEVEAMSLWKTSYQKKTGKYRGFTVWVSKEIHIPAVKTLIDRIPASQ
jgi:hypothetical protein